MSDANAAPPPPLDRQRVQEFARTLFGHVSGVSVLHCMTVSLAEGGAGLGTCWGTETARRMLADAGFTSSRCATCPARRTASSSAGAEPPLGASIPSWR